MLRAILNKKNISTYKLEKMSKVPHATLLDLYSEKTNVDNCSVKLLFNISKTLNMSMDKLYNLLSYNDLSLFAYSEELDLFKNNLSHEISSIGDIKFLDKYLRNNHVEMLYNKGNSLESLYLLSLIDYLCEQHNLPIPKNYQYIRANKLDRIYVPKSIYLLLSCRQITVSKIFQESIPSFLTHNIVEADIY